MWSRQTPTGRVCVCETERGMRETVSEGVTGAQQSDKRWTEEHTHILTNDKMKRTN